MKHLVVLCMLLLVGGMQARAQGIIDRNHVPSRERVDPKERAKSDIDGNNIRATIFNWGQTGRTGVVPDEIPYEWPKNTRQHYIALTGVFIGARVKDAVQDTSFYIVDIPNYRSNPHDENRSWTLEPVKGYINPNLNPKQIARSDDPSTWPPFWPDKLEDPVDPGWRGSWNGYFGKNVFNADQELFYKAGDDQYDRYNGLYTPFTYYPDSTDHTRFGLGLLIPTRVMAWSQVLINDVMFIIHAVKNDGTEDLRQVGVTLWLADLVGGDGDSQDDQPFYDLLLDVAFMTDRDGIGNQFFGSKQVGAAAAVFLETPGNPFDRIDNDGDGTTGIPIGAPGEPGSPVVTADMLVGECPDTGEDAGLDRPECFDGIDNNGNGLIDENKTHVPVGTPGQIDYQAGVGYADYIDNDDDGEVGSPIITSTMVQQAAGDRWKRWPPESDWIEGEGVHLIMVEADDEGHAFKDGIDNDNTCDDPSSYLDEPGSPRVTQEMIDAAASDSYGRYRVPGTSIILYQLGPEDLDKCYADGIDNDGDGAVDEGIDEGIDEMIDESRADGIDNDEDWRPTLDDVGLDGAAFTGDPGEGDGKPTSGVGTGLPGEPNIDITDISESDQIGITNVQYDPAGGINYQQISDRELFNRFMVPGKFYDVTQPLTGDYDLFVSSGVFPLKAGQTERISYAIIMGTDDRNASTREVRFRDILNKEVYARESYEADYRFAQAPITPTVTAVPGDGKVTLYWDSKAEDSFDSFMFDIGLPAYDFEGYRVYRATDPAFLDAKVITDGFGNLQFLKPIAQFDKIDEYEGFHPVAVNGTQFYLGNNIQDPGEAANGLTHVFVDSTAINGVTYYYAVTAYDFGSTIANIPPTETPIRIRFLPDGGIETGPNVVQVTPQPAVLGYVNADIDTLARVQGFTTSRIGYRIVDPTKIEDGHRYRIVFEDTLIQGTSRAPDTLTTKNFSLVDVTDGDTLILRSDTFKPGREVPVVEGFQLLFFPETFVDIDRTRTGWNHPEVLPIAMRRYQDRIHRGFRNPFDYVVEVRDLATGCVSEELQVRVTRRRTLPAKQTNVCVFRYELENGERVSKPVKFAMWDLTGENPDPYGTGPATFSADTTEAESDRIILIETTPDGEEKVTWEISLDFTYRNKRNPEAGDVANIVTKKPFLSWDVFEFTTRGATVDQEKAASLLDQVTVVPNPYVAANEFEPVNPFQTGRGPRRIRFMHVPPRCTIRIFTMSGQLVRVLEHYEGSNDQLPPEALLSGSVEWDLLSEEGLAVSYGVYLYHLEAPGIGEKTGTFAIIK